MVRSATFKISNRVLVAIASCLQRTAGSLFNDISIPITYFHLLIADLFGLFVNRFMSLNVLTRIVSFTYIVPKSLVLF